MASPLVPCSRIEGVLMTVTGMTRKDYMENRITHLEYYGNVARIAGIRFSEEFLTRCDKALTAGDEHLNTIPLSTWDMMGAAWRVRIASALKQVNNTGGVSLSDLVCTLKSAAIIWINKGDYENPQGMQVYLHGRRARTGSTAV